MATEVLMPALSPTMEEGTLAKWLVKEGDMVKSGQILAEIETDKATMEFEAVDEGTVGRILVAEGTGGVKVNTPILVLVEAGETGSDAPKAAVVAAVAATEMPVETKTAPVPSATRIRPTVPSSTASNSIVALSVSISARIWPDLTTSPSFTSHFASVPSSIVGDSAGINTSVAMSVPPQA